MITAEVAGLRVVAGRPGERGPFISVVIMQWFPSTAKRRRM